MKLSRLFIKYDIINVTDWWSYQYMIRKMLKMDKKYQSPIDK